MTLIDEPVEVSLDPTGSPVGFRWRGVRYLAKGKPLRWFTRKQWWLESSRVQRGIGASVLEVEVWRIVADRDAKAFKLSNDGGVWRLISADD